MDIRRVAILGAGHGGCAAACDLAQRGIEVRLHARREDSLAPLRAEGGVRAEGALHGLVPVAVMTTNLAEAVAGADLVMLVVPAVAHGFYARALAPLLGSGQPVFINPGHTGGGLHFVHELKRAGYRGEVKTCETVTLTYICRKTGPATVAIFSHTRNLGFAAFPGRHADELLDALRPLYPEITPASSVLETAFGNINAVLHPPGMVLNAGWIEDTGGDFLFYREGITPAVGRVIAAVDGERMAVAAALGVPATSFIEAFFNAGLTTRAAMESGDIARACRESTPNKAIRSPPGLDHRYIHEDIGYGLVPLTAFAGLCGVETPTIDALIHLASEMMEIPYGASGLTLAGMGLAALAGDDLARFVMEGA